MASHVFRHSMLNGFNVINLLNEEKIIGFIIWDGNDDGRVEDLYVNPKYRRQGFATKLWNEAVNHSKMNCIAKPAHSETRTHLGDLWAKTMPNYFETEGIIEAYTD